MEEKQTFRHPILFVPALLSARNGFPFHLVMSKSSSWPMLEFTSSVELLDSCQQNYPCPLLHFRNSVFIPLLYTARLQVRTYFWLLSASHSAQDIITPSLTLLRTGCHVRDAMEVDLEGSNAMRCTLWGNREYREAHETSAWDHAPT